jgi:ankyrin repeat protein
MASGEYVDVARCFEEAVKSPRAVTVKHLIGLGHSPTNEAVVNAARYNATEALQIMSHSGADLEAHDDLGRSPLANAAMYGSAEAVRFLLNAGAAVDAADEHHGRTPLLWAVCEENSSPGPIVSMLLEAGANKEAKDSDGRCVKDLLGFIEDDERRAAFSHALGTR